MIKSTVPYKILLGQLGANGDCLFATAIARQIKTDYPGCHLTWAVGTAYRSILKNNPFVDEIWEIPVANQQDLWDKWDAFEKEALARKRRGEFDEIYFTQIPPRNFKNFDGTVRASIFRGYPRPITVSDAPVVLLTPEEVTNVARFADIHRLSNYSHVILFECSSSSEQSFVTPYFATDVAQRLTKLIPDVCIILSSNVATTSADPRIINGSGLSFRENAELSKYCTLLVGCSSGISWICTSDWAKPLPMVQLLSKDKSVYASFIHDYEYRNKSTDSIIEMTDCSVDKVVRCLKSIITTGFAQSRIIYNERIPVRFDFYLNVVYQWLLLQGRYRDAFISLMNTAKRYGLHPQLVSGIVRKCYRFILKRIKG